MTFPDLKIRKCHFFIKYLHICFFCCNFAAESSKGEGIMSVQKHSLDRKQLLSKQSATQDVK